MQSFVINLDRATERLAHIEATFARLGLSFERVPAIDGRRLEADEIDRWQRPGSAVGPSEIACFLSHRRCWQEIVARDLAHAAIFEDDVLLSSDAAEFLSSAEWIVGDAHIVKLETNGRPTFVARNPASTHSGRELRRLTGPHFNAAAYIVSRSAAERLIEASNVIEMPVDLFLFDARGLQQWPTYQLIPALCAQPFVAHRLNLAPGPRDLEPSTIEEDRRRRRPRGWRRLQHKLRRIIEELRQTSRGFVVRLTGPHQWGPVPFK